MGIRKHYNLKICPVCDREYHPNPAFLRCKRRYCSERCRKLADCMTARCPVRLHQRPKGI